jgi:glycosyltransferase involved in cell wall biosynthesis
MECKNMRSSAVELSFVLPCLNESETLADCIRLAHRGAQSAGVTEYEIVIADNGSEDGSQEIAIREGAVVVDVAQRGYGAALRTGIDFAQGKFVIMGDSDLSYDFSEIGKFVARLRDGYQLVMGSRLKGTIKKGAMPWLHRYLGTPVLTAIGNLFFGSKFSDFNCGMRGFDREAIQALNLRTDGMEFASEMIIRATLAKLSALEVSINFSPDGRSRRPYLRTWRDGWRHLRFLLLYSPRWLLLYPGVFMTLVGISISLLLFPGPLQIGRIEFDVHTLLVSSMLFVIGVQLVFLAAFFRTYAARIGLLPESDKLENFLEKFSLNFGLIVGLVVTLFGLLLIVNGFLIWNAHSFGALVETQHTLRIIIGGTMLSILGVEAIFNSFAFSLMNLR